VIKIQVSGTSPACAARRNQGEIGVAAGRAWAILDFPKKVQKSKTADEQDVRSREHSPIRFGNWTPSDGLPNMPGMWTNIH
jgi:hypothetical protein